MPPKDGLQRAFEETRCEADGLVGAVRVVVTVRNPVDEGRTENDVSFVDELGFPLKDVR